MSLTTQAASYVKTFILYILFLVFCCIPVLLAMVVYQLHQFQIPPSISAPAVNDHILLGAEFLGTGKLQAPEDIAYHSESGLIYTGCADGWVKRVRVNGTMVEDWVNTGGRPLGLAFGHFGEVIVADAYKGLLKISTKGEIEQLSGEANGVKFKLTDAAAIADNGVIYFTDASHKYDLKDFILDIAEQGRNGRLMSFDPLTKQTKVLLADLYFANGVTISPDQTSVIFCETTMARCRRYYIKGEKKGSVENFVSDLPGLPDNIRYDGEGCYWIALFVRVTAELNLVLRYPFLRKVFMLLEKYDSVPRIERDGGVISVDLEGKPVSHYYDPGLSLVSTGLKIGNHLYLGSIHYLYIIRINLHQL